jgi:hypothetical protein
MTGDLRGTASNFLLCMSWCPISDAQLRIPEEGMTKPKDSEVKSIKSITWLQWTPSRNLLNFPTQYNALGLYFNFTLGSAPGAALYKGSKLPEHSLASCDKHPFCKNVRQAIMCR